jgi:hypothetical protein
VIAHYRHNVENEVALITAIEEVGETVIESRNHEQRPAAHCFGSNAQIWSKAVQLLSERTFHYCHVVILGFKTSAHAELGGHGIGELVVLQYVAAQLDNGRTGGEHDARTIDALQSNYVGRHVGSFLLRHRRTIEHFLDGTAVEATSVETRP